MNKLTRLFVIMTIFGLSYANFETTKVRVKRGEHGFILRSCQASVQLNRKYRTNPDTNALKIESQSADYGRILNENSAKRFKFSDKIPTYSGKTARTRTIRNEKDILQDSPFRTIDVTTAIDDRPQIFRKKESLPQLDRVVTAKKLDSEASIIIVEKVH